MAWLRIRLTEEEQEAVQRERELHPNPCVRRKLWVIWLLHCGATREKAAQVMGVARSTVERDVAEFRSGGLDALRERGPKYRPSSDLQKYSDVLRKSFEECPAATIAEACQRISDLTGVVRKPTQVRRFLKGLGLKWQRIRAIPVPPKKTWQSTLPTRPHSMTAS